MDLFHRRRVVFSYLVYKRFVWNRTRLWVHPFTESRLIRGRFRMAFGDLRENSGKFFYYFRMSVHSFDELEDVYKRQ